MIRAASDLKLPTLWHKPDLFDEFTDAFGRFQAGIPLVQGFGQIHDLLAVQGITDMTRTPDNVC